MRPDKIVLTITLLMALVTSCPGDPNCYSCIPEHAPRCVFCESSILNPVTNLCDTKVFPVVENCLSYSGQPGNTQCDFCYPGYALINQTCVKCTTENCYWCDKNQICAACSKGMQLVVDRENPKNNRCAKEVKCRIPNCEVCFDDYPGSEKCHICFPGFIQKHNECLPSPIENCDVLNFNDDKLCMICRIGFYLAADYTCKARTTESSESMNKNLIDWSLLIALGAVIYFVYARI